MEDNTVQKEKFFDEILPENPEEGGIPQAADIERLKLSDDELEQVSGGRIVSKQDLSDCYYCGKKHVLMQYYPWIIKPAGSRTCYMCATKYECSTNGTYYTLPLMSGETAYFNERMIRIG